MEETPLYSAEEADTHERETIKMISITMKEFKRFESLKAELARHKEYLEEGNLMYDFKSWCKYDDELHTPPAQEK